MIKRTLFILFCCAALFPHSLLSCDVCASSVGNMGIGLLTDYRSNFLQIGYSLSPFRSSSERGYTIKDDFHQMDLTCRYAITKRIRIMAQVPFGYKSRTLENDKQVEQGLADISVSATYVLLANKAILWNTNLYLEAGLGASLPTGKYDKYIYDKNLPKSFNLGNGAMGYTTQANALWSYNTIGLVANVFYQLNSKTNSDYKFGNEFTTRLTGFKAWDTNQLQWIPNVGVSLETASKDHYANGKVVEDTGGRGCFMTTGVNIKTERWLAGLSYALPFAGNYASGSTEVKGRISGQVSYLF